MKSSAWVIPFAAIATVGLVGCSRSGDATTRPDQLMAFKNTFTFPASDEVREISFHSEGAWAPSMGGYRSLMRFTYVSNVFNRIVKEQGLSIGQISSSIPDDPPDWWKEPVPDTKVFSVFTNGIVKLMWRGKADGFVFYTEFNVD